MAILPSSGSPCLAPVTLVLCMVHAVVGQDDDTPAVPEVSPGVDSRYEECRSGKCATFCEGVDQIGKSTEVAVMGYKQQKGEANVWCAGPADAPNVFFWDSFVDEAAYVSGLLGNFEQGYVVITCVPEPASYDRYLVRNVTTYAAQNSQNGGTYKFPPLNITAGAFTLSRFTPGPTPEPPTPEPTPESTSDLTDQTANPGDGSGGDADRQPTPAPGAGDSNKEKGLAKDKKKDGWQQVTARWFPVWLAASLLLCVLICALYLARRRQDQTERAQHRDEILLHNDSDGYTSDSDCADSLDGMFDEASTTTTSLSDSDFNSADDENEKKRRSQRQTAPPQPPQPHYDPNYDTAEFVDPNDNAVKKPARVAPHVEAFDVTGATVVAKKGKVKANKDAVMNPLEEVECGADHILGGTPTVPPATEEKAAEWIL